MNPELVPTTELEKAYVQSGGWSAERTWRQAIRELTRAKYSVAAGLILRLAVSLCLTGQFVYYSDAVRALGQLAGNLSPGDRFKLFILCCREVARLRLALEDQEVQPDFQTLLSNSLDLPGVRFESKSEIGVWLRPILVLMSGILLFSDYEKLQKALMKLRLAQLYRRPISKAELYELGSSFKDQERSANLDQFLGTVGTFDNPPFALQTLYTCGCAFRQESKDAPIQKSNRQLPVNAHSTPPVAKRLTVDEKLVELKDKFLSDEHSFGSSSIQSIHALIRLTDLALEHKKPSIAECIERMVEVVHDESAELSEYALRRIYTISGKIQILPEFSESARKIQQKIFELREVSLGYDMNMALSLFRLLSLWQATNSPDEATQFCQQLLKRVSANLDEHELVWRQIKSANDRIAELADSSKDCPEQFTIPTLVNYRDFDEFVSMLAVVALDHYHNGRLEEAEAVLQETCAYYLECTSDVARRVGEMLWLLVETPLRTRPWFASRLVELSVLKAFDRHLRRRADMHVNRLIELESDQAAAERLRHYAWSLVTQSPGPDDYPLLAARGPGTHAIVPTRLSEIIQSQRGKSAEKIDAHLRELWQIEDLSRSRNWTEVQKRLLKLVICSPEENQQHALVKVEKSPRQPNAYSSHERTLSLIKILFFAIADEADEVAECVLYLGLSSATTYHIPAICSLAEMLAGRFEKTRNDEAWLRVTNKVLESPILLKDDRNRFLLRIASHHVECGRIFDAVALVHMAFYDIPEPYDNQESGTDPLILSDSHG